MTLIINFVAGPATGKSTNSAELFAKLKRMKYKCELVTEYAKDMYWDGRLGELNQYSQTYLFAKQAHRLQRLLGKVDFVITDSPLLLSLYYNKEGGPLNDLILHEFRKMNNFVFFLNRKKEYESYGRSQSAEEAKAIDSALYSILVANHIDFEIVDADENCVEKILLILEARGILNAAERLNSH